METDNIINQLNHNGYYIIKNFINNNDFEIIRKYWLNYFENIKIQNKNYNIHKTGIILGDKNYLATSKKNSKENDIDFSTINNHSYLLGGNLINKIDILFKKIERNND